MPVDDNDDAAAELEAHEGPSQNAQSIGLSAHVLGLFTWVVGPAILLLFATDQSTFARRHTRKALNFQVSQVFYYMVAILVCVLTGFAVYLLTDQGRFGFIAGYALFLLLAIGFTLFEVVVIARGGIAAYRGQEYRYALTIRLF
jgi:hypothetical protein